ncbi:hypothetical protein BGX31_006161 [Mortierella sp. GBA43]|nr:hypothetical protein BGX31_006161 [Mortierella sp. GBA43]
MSNYGTTSARREDEEALLNRQPSARTHANDTFYGRTIIHIHSNRKRYFALWLLAAIAVVSTVVGLFYYHKSHNHHKGDPNGFFTATHPSDDVCKSDRSYGITIILSIFFGYIGVDRFYLGHIITGLLKLVTAGGFGIWYVVDIILIVIGALPDHNGCRLTAP